MPPSSATARWKPISRSVAAASVEIWPNSQQARMRRGRIGQLLVDAQLELAARQQARARDVAGLVGVALAHVEHDQVVVAAPRRAPSARPCDMNGTVAAASASSCATVLPPLMLVRSASVRWVGIVRLRLRIISTNAARSRFCRRGLVAISCADGRVAAALVVVRRIDLERRVELQQLLEQAVVERLRIAGRQVGAAGAADQQRVAGEHAVLDRPGTSSRAVWPGRVQHLQPQLADDEQLAVVERACRRTAPGSRGASPPARRAARASSRVAEKWSAWVWVSIT